MSLLGHEAELRNYSLEQELLFFFAQLAIPEE